MQRHFARLLFASSVMLLFVLGAGRDASAAERWIDRPMTLHRLVFAGDVGLGIGHLRPPIGPSTTGLGMNLEGAIGITERLELGLRTGLRFGNDGRFTSADYYARTLWTETWGTRAGSVANPEFRIRWVAYSGSIAEVGLDGRLFVPVEQGSRVGMMFGVPFAFHVTDFMRIDTGIYVPVVFYDSAFNGISVPAYLWFQPSEHLWLGPMFAVRFIDPGPATNHDTSLLLGFGLGYQVASSVDLKMMFLLPNADNDLSRALGFGFGAQFRIGE